MLQSYSAEELHLDMCYAVADLIGEYNNYSLYDATCVCIKCDA